MILARLPKPGGSALAGIEPPPDGGGAPSAAAAAAVWNWCQPDAPANLRYAARVGPVSSSSRCADCSYSETSPPSALSSPARWPGGAR